MKKSTLAIIIYQTLCMMTLNPVAHAADAPLLTIPVNSPAFVFSPGNWTGDDGRGGKNFRQTWYPGAYFRVNWTTQDSHPVAKILLDTSTYTTSFKPPMIAYSIDGVWKSKIPCSNGITVDEITGPGPHALDVYLYWSEQKERWGSDGQSGLNVLRVRGLQCDASSTPITGPPLSRWALIVGDSITEGSGASGLAAYSNLIGQALQTQGYEYDISACGWSGWLNKGDGPPGDVPGYYVVHQSGNGMDGSYDNGASRWNKIDGNRHSLLDSKGHLSAYGQTGQEPALIMINNGTNDILHGSNPKDTSAAIYQGLTALRAAAPHAKIIILIPFGQYEAALLKNAVEKRQHATPPDNRISVIDLGLDVAKTLKAKDGLMGGLHPNDLGHAHFAAKIIPQMMKILLTN